jgi:hypothetical protein
MATASHIVPIIKLSSHAAAKTNRRPRTEDDTGFVADGDFRDNVLYHAGMVLYRERH